MLISGCAGSTLCSLVPPLGLTGMQHALVAFAGCRSWYQSVVHSHTLPAMSYKTIAVGREGAHGRRPLIAISHQVLPGKFSLPGVGHHLATRSEFIPPGIHGTLY